MTGFGIIDTTCTPEGYVHTNCLETLESKAYKRYLEREWPVLFFSAHRLPVYIVAASITFILGYQIGISALLTINDSFLDVFFQPNLGVQGYFSKFNRPGLPLFISSFYTAALAAWIITPCNVMFRLLEMRKRMVLASLCLLCGATLTCFATTLTILVGGRMLLGFGIGLSLHIMPIYVSNITPMNPRLLYNAFQLVVSLGVIFAPINISQGWQAGLGFAILPALAALVCSCCLPNVQVDKEEEEVSKQQPWTELFKKKKKKNIPHLVTAILLPLLQQLSGISVMVLFTPMMAYGLGDNDKFIIHKEGFNSFAWMLSRIFCEMAVPLAKMSRRKLVITFGVLMVICDYSIAKRIGYYRWKYRDSEFLWLLSFFIHIGCSGWEYISWTFLNETLPQEIRGVAWRLSMSVVLICYALVAHFGLPLLAYKEELHMFKIMYCLVIFGMVVFYALLPDDKWSILLMGPVVYLWENHSFWKRYEMKSDDDDQNTAALHDLPF